MKIPKIDTINKIIRALNRPWVLILGIGFLCIPTTKMTEALETGAEFLKIDTDARIVSMGSTFAASAEGVNSMMYNPAMMSTIKNTEFGFSHTKWLLDSSHNFIGFAMPVSGLGAGDSGLERNPRTESRTPFVIGLGITRLTTGSIESRSADRSRTGTYQASDQAISISGAKKINNTRLGASVKYIESSIAGEKASSIAVDFGLSRQLKSLPLMIGLSVQNFGKSMKFINQEDPLPLKVTMGALVGIIPGFNMALDIQRAVYDKQTTFNLGTEYSVFPGFALRSGLAITDGTRDSGLGIGKNLNMGAGFKMMGTQIDYAVTPFGELGNAQRITVKRKF